jgi:hypothetical protein
MMGMSDNLTAVLLRTLFDMEGYFPNPNKHKGGSEIEFTSKSKKLVEQVQILLNRFGIVGRFKEKIINNQSYWRLLIGGSDNHRLFREKIGSNIKHKKENLNLLCQLSLKRNKFHLPIPHLLNNYREEIGMTQKQFFLDKKYFYDLKKRNRISYNKIEKMYESTHNEFLKIFAESDNIWDEIVSIEKEGYDGYVYDLTVEDNHTFILSNGLIAHNTSLANRISKDFTGEELGTVSRIPHETREIQVKEKVRIKKGKKSLDFNLIDTPGIATKIDFTDFLKHGLSPKESKERAKEATQGVIEAIKWLENVDCVLVVLDSTENPYNQVNITLIGNLAARKIPVLIVANKADLKKSRLKRIESTFPQYKVVPMSALTGKNIDLFYDELFKLVK